MQIEGLMNVFNDDAWFNARLPMLGIWFVCLRCRDYWGLMIISILDKFNVKPFWAKRVLLSNTPMSQQG